jgi:hypothetical protein
MSLRMCYYRRKRRLSAMQFTALFQILPCDSPLCESSISRTSIKLDFITAQVCENIFWCYRMLLRFCLTNNAICQPHRTTTFCVSANWHIDCLFIGIYLTKRGVLCVCMWQALSDEEIERGSWNFGDIFMIIMGFAVRNGTRICPTGRGVSPM